MGFELRENPPIPVVALQGTEIGKFLFVVAVPAKKDCGDIIEALEAHGQICRVEAHPKTIAKIQAMPDEPIPEPAPVKVEPVKEAPKKMVPKKMVPKKEEPKKDKE